MSLTIALIQNQFPESTHWGGISTFGWFFSHALAQAGCTVHVVAQSADEKVEKAITLSKQIVVHRIPGKSPMPGHAVSVLRKVLPSKQRWFVKNAHLKVKQLQEAGVNLDIINAADYLGTAYYMLKDTSLKVPIVVTCHTPSFLADAFNEEEHSIQPKKIYDYESYSIQHAKGLISPSKRLIQLLSSKTERPMGDFHQINYPYNVVEELQLQPEPNTLLTRPFVLFVGRVERRKGVETLLKAWSHTHLSHTHHLVLAGKKTNHFKEFEAQAASSSTSNILFLGEQNRSQLSWLYRNADLVTLPSEPFENYPYACIEAMAHGAPVLVSDSGGMSELVSDTQNGWLFKPGDHQHLAHQIDEIMKLTVSKRNECGNAAQQTIRKVNDPARIATRTLKYFTSILES